MNRLKRMLARVAGIKAKPRAKVSPQLPVFDGEVDHRGKKIAGKVYLPNSAPCPHNLLVRDAEHGDWVTTCIGRVGHLIHGPKHCDEYGRIWE